LSLQFLPVPGAGLRLRALAPTQKEPPFLLAQLVVLLVYVGLLVLAVKKVPYKAGTRDLIESSVLVYAICKRESKV
jgi:hypothetical protein